MSRDVEFDRLLSSRDGYQGFWPPGGGAATFHATLGVTPGYGHHNEASVTVEQVALAWQDITATQAHLYNDIIPGCVIHEAVVAYATAHGCPEGGERIFVLTGVANHHFVHNDLMWHKAVEAALVKLAARFDQSTTQLLTTSAYGVSDFHYFYPRET